MPTVMEPTGPAAERFGARMGFISNRIGGKQLGYNITAIPKGKRAFPFHNHQVNMMYVGKEGSVYITGKVNRWTVIFCSCSNLYEASFSQVFSKFAGAWRVDG